MKPWAPWLAGLICLIASVVATATTGPLQTAAWVVTAVVMVIPIIIISRAVYRRLRPERRNSKKAHHGCPSPGGRFVLIAACLTMGSALEDL
jgi:membrane protein implicated in regulation of membrane protease activity